MPTPASDTPGSAATTPVCLCIPTFRAAQTLAATVESIRGQSHTCWHLHIVDNGSDDSTLAIARDLAGRDPRISVHAHAVNIGGEGNFTRCIGMMDGEIGAILHADDIYDHGFLASAVADLQAHPEVGAVFCESQDIDGQGRPRRRSGRPWPGRIAGGLSILDHDQVLDLVYWYGNHFICPSAVVRSSIYRDSIRVWDGARFATSADLDVWLRISRGHRIAVRHLPLIRYRISSASISYHMARSRTTEHDLFRVLDAWAEHVGTWADDRRRRRLRGRALLRAKDHVNRALNCLIVGRWTESWRLWWAGMASPGVAWAWLDPWHRRFMIAGCALLPFMAMGWLAPVRSLLVRIRHGSPS